MPPPNIRSHSVGELPGIDELLELLSVVGAAIEALGSGLICSAVTSSLLIEVPIGVQVIRVSNGLVVG